MRILIYGAGVIGSFYASRFVKAGLDVTVLARGQGQKNYRDTVYGTEARQERIKLRLRRSVS